MKACFGTTKYCNAFLKGVICNNPECLYLHDIGTPLFTCPIALLLLLLRFKQKNLQFSTPSPLSNSHLVRACS